MESMSAQTNLDRHPRRLRLLAVTCCATVVVSACTTAKSTHLGGDSTVDSASPGSASDTSSAAITASSSALSTSDASTSTSEASPAPVTSGPLTADTSPATAAPTAAPDTDATTTSVGSTPDLRLPAAARVVSLSWPSNEDGWVLTDDEHGGRSLMHTTDGGTTWTAIMDATGVNQVLFADGTNGWLAGNGLRSTHDGGATWMSAAVPDAGDVAAVAAARGTVHVGYIGSTSGAVGVASSPIDHDDFAAASFTIPAGAGPRLDLSLTAGGPYAALIYDDRTFVGAAQIVNGKWGKWGVTCPFDNPTATVGLSPGGQNLAVACGPSGFGDAAPIVAADLSSGGLNWTPVEPASGSPDEGQATLDFVAATDAGVRIVAYTKADGSGMIAGSSDGGASWPARTPLPAGTSLSAFAHLPDGRLLVAVAPAGGLISADGLTWKAVAETS